MSKVIANLGRKLSLLFGENDPIDDIALREETNAKALLRKSYIADLLPYRTWDKTSRLFENKSSLGFSFELFVHGSPRDILREMSGLVPALFLPSASMQTLLFADPHISKELERWEKKAGSVGGLFQEIASKRKKQFEADSLAKIPPIGCPPRNFRVFFPILFPKMCFQDLSFCAGSLLLKRKPLRF